jgi:hypothetical protein
MPEMPQNVCRMCSLAVVLANDVSRYGRYSKSIRPDECGKAGKQLTILFTSNSTFEQVCGACREGQLIPLFTVRTKPQTPKLSRQAAAKPQGTSFPHPSSIF